MNILYAKDMCDEDLELIAELGNMPVNDKDMLFSNRDSYESVAAQINSGKDMRDFYQFVTIDEIMNEE